MKFNVKTPSTPKFLKSVRYTLAGVNGVFLITGIFLIIVGAVSLTTYSEYEGLITKRFFTLPGFVIATGVLIFVAAVLGFYGALSEGFYFIAAYVICLAVILVFEVAMTITAYVMQGNVASEIQSTMLDSLRQYSQRIEVAAMWDDLQRQFECCGVGGRFDYVSNLIPVSCCYIPIGAIGSFYCETANAHEQGCSNALGELLSYHAFIIAVAALCTACLQVLITGMAAWLAYRSKFEEVELES